jgi:transcriptional regulator with XRE-family HTH domain
MINLQLGQRLRELRKHHHYTQEYISSLLNIERPAYSNYECGKRTPPLELIIQLADLYQISLEDLLCNPDFSACAATNEFSLSSITKDEKILLRIYRMLSKEQRHEILHFMQYKMHQSKNL